MGFSRSGDPSRPEDHGLQEGEVDFGDSYASDPPGEAVDQWWHDKENGSAISDASWTDQLRQRLETKDDLKISREALLPEEPVEVSDDGAVPDIKQRRPSVGKTSGGFVINGDPPSPPAEETLHGGHFAPQQDDAWTPEEEIASPLAGRSARRPADLDEPSLRSEEPLRRREARSLRRDADEETFDEPVSPRRSKRNSLADSIVVDDDEGFARQASPRRPAAPAEPSLREQPMARRARPQPEPAFHEPAPQRKAPRQRAMSDELMLDDDGSATPRRRAPSPPPPGRPAPRAPRAPRAALHRAPTRADMKRSSPSRFLMWPLVLTLIGAGAYWFTMQPSATDDLRSTINQVTQSIDVPLDVITGAGQQAGAPTVSERLLGGSSADNIDERSQAERAIASLGSTSGLQPSTANQPPIPALKPRDPASLAGAPAASQGLPAASNPTQLAQNEDSNPPLSSVIERLWRYLVQG